MGSFQLFPDAASTVSQRVDAIYLSLVAVSLFFTFLICGLILYFGVRYRRGSPASRANPPISYLLEVTWSVIPLALMMVMFGWGASVFFEMQTPPSHAQEVTVVAKQWMWKLQHAEGRAELNQLHIPVGQPIRLKMISEDVIHSFYVPAFRVKQDVLPGYYTRLWFEATKPGSYHLFCAEYCGTEHSHMRGTVIVMEPDAYADWLAGDSDVAPEVAGQKLFDRYRCGSCHRPEGGIGPSLVRVAGKEVRLEGGGAVQADEQYLRNSILNPAQQIVAGYRPEMPTYRGQLDEVQVLQIIAYLKSLTRGDENAK
jgi:cytochrome c oxidase subunit 2